MFKNIGVPDLLAFIECKRGTDRPRESQLEWERKTGTRVWIFYFPDPTSSKALCFYGYEEFATYLANPIGEPTANRFYEEAFALEYGKASVEEQHNEKPEVYT